MNKRKTVRCWFSIFTLLNLYILLLGLFLFYLFFKF